MSYWDWAVEVHGREGVDAALTELQDAHGQSVAYLLWAAWAAHEGRPLQGVLLAQAAELTRHWEDAATGPLRSARRGLKAPAPPIEDAARLALREEVRKSEFAAERLLMETLERLAPEPAPASGDLGQALLDASTVWGEGAPEAQLKDLAARLA
jgi:uncharacterized protein (TIGR02444 family)